MIFYIFYVVMDALRFSCVGGRERCLEDVYERLECRRVGTERGTKSEVGWRKRESCTKEG